MSDSHCLATRWLGLLTEVSEDNPQSQYLIERKRGLSGVRLDLDSHLIAVCRKPA